jgi:hypothetical protein
MTRFLLSCSTTIGYPDSIALYVKKHDTVLDDSGNDTNTVIRGD